MKFCPHCGSIMIPTPGIGLACSCGHQEQHDGKIVHKHEHKTKDIIVLEDGEEHKNNNPLTEATCPKCEHKKAHYFIKQTRASDEPPTRFFECEKCRHKWREY